MVILSRKVSGVQYRKATASHLPWLPRFRPRLRTRLPARRIAKHILCGQNVRQVTFIELFQPRPEISHCPRERGVPHGGLWGGRVAAPTTLATVTWAYVLRMLPIRKRILKAQWIASRMNTITQHIASALLSRRLKPPAKSHSAVSTENRGHGH
jgi:hypothetical protein